ncbi:MAG: hypothetical protein AB7N76_28405 [Planctomycetota bacterium]
MTAGQEDPLALRALVRAFEERPLPFADWHHREHLVVCCWLLLEHPLAEATVRLRAGIQTFNARHGIEQTPTGGYHETVTLCFLRLIDAFLTERGREAPREVLVAEVGARFADKYCVLEHYSRERINSWEARTGWVEPDLKPLP